MTAMIRSIIALQEPYCNEFLNCLFLLPFGYCVMLTADCLLPTAYCLLTTFFAVVSREIGNVTSVP